MLTCCASLFQKKKILLIWKKIMVVSNCSEVLRIKKLSPLKTQGFVKSLGHIKTWRHKPIFLAVAIKANFHQGKLKWLQQALRAFLQQWHLTDAVSTWITLGGPQHSLIKWQEHSLWEECVKAQLLKEPHMEESITGHGTWGMRPQLCLPEMLINARGALLSLLTRTGSSTGRVECLHWTTVLVSQGRDESINYWNADAFIEISASLITWASRVTSLNQKLVHSQGISYLFMSAPMAFLSFDKPR